MTERRTRAPRAARKPPAPPAAKKSTLAKTTTRTAAKKSVAKKSAAKKAPARKTTPQKTTPQKTTPRTRRPAQPEGSLPASKPATPPQTTPAPSKPVTEPRGPVEQATIDELAAAGRHATALAASAITMARLVDTGSPSAALAAASELRLTLAAIRAARPMGQVGGQDPDGNVTPPSRLAELRRARGGRGA